MFVELHAEPESIVRGQSAVLSWSSDYAESCSLEPNIGVVPINGTLSVGPTETTTYTIVATGQGGTITDQVTVVVTDPAPTVEFTASSDTILLGDSVTLSWESQYASSCSIEPGIGVVEPNGSTTVSPTETTTYTITVTGSGGTSSAHLTIAVNNPLPELTFSATPSSVLLGQKSTLTWSSLYADSVEIDSGIGAVEDNGSLDVYPSLTTTYTITASGAGGTNTAQVTVIVTYPPPTATLEIAPSEITLGEEAILSWACANVTSVTIDHGIGSVSGSGSINVSPTETTTYSLVASGLGGSVSVAATVTVIIPPTVDLQIEPNSISAGESASLVWTSTNAATVIIDNGIGSVEPDGSRLISPAVSSTYTITAIGADGVTSATDSATLTVITPLPIVSFGANPQSINVGNSAELSWSTTFADTVSIEPGIGTVPVNGVQTVSPTQTTSYTMTASGAGGISTETTVVTVIQPPTVEISASANSINEGETVTLTWSADNADTCNIEPGIGMVSVTGSTNVAPSQTTTYIITATGPGGTALSSVEIVVQPMTGPPSVEFNPTEITIDQGGSATLSWTTFGADNVHIDNGVGNVSVTGEYAVAPEHTTIYTITAFGPNGSNSAQAVVHVTGNPYPQSEGSFGYMYNDLIPIDSTKNEYEEEQFSLISGIVNDVSGQPIENVIISILGQPEYGTVLTNQEGGFQIPVEGGSVMTVEYKKEGLITAQRQVYVPWNDFVLADTVVLLEQDSLATTVIFDGNPTTVTTHQSSVISDEFGSRSLSLVFTGDNKAWAVDEHGNDIQQLGTISTRATEFTTPISMPAKLPPNSAFTYCAELTVDGVERIRFEKPVTAWVSNFLGFEVGSIVPVGYYDRNRGTWLPANNGIVVQLLDLDFDGVVDALDATGDGQADDLNEDGFLGDEVHGLDDPTKYEPGATFWRFGVNHFSPWDCNWPYGPPVDAIPPNALDISQEDSQNPEPQICPTEDVASFVEQRSRVVHEDIPIPGTNLTLHYSGNRVSGYMAVVNVPVSGESVPSSLKSIIVQMKVAGQLQEKTLLPEPNQSVQFVWDRKDALGRNVKSSTTAHIKVGFVYEAEYRSPGVSYPEAFAQPGIETIGIPARQEIVTWRQNDIEIEGQGKTTIADGWTVNVNHSLNSDMKTLYKGDGTILKNNNVRMLQIVAGMSTNASSEDSIPADRAYVGQYTAVAVDSNGEIYFYEHNRIRKIDREGLVYTVAGTGVEGSSGDGGPAIEAQIGELSQMDMAIDFQGNLYFFEHDYYKVRKIDKNGVISTVAGNGNYAPNFDENGDGGLAVDAPLGGVSGITVDDQGNLYLLDNVMNVLRKVDTNGKITTIADNFLGSYLEDIVADSSGNLFVAMFTGSPANSGILKIDRFGLITQIAGSYNSNCLDGCVATDAKIGRIRGLALDSWGNIYFTESNASYPYYNAGYRVGKIDTTGYLTTIAGNGPNPNSILDNVPAKTTTVGDARRIAVSPNGSIYFSSGSLLMKLSFRKPSIFDTTTFQNVDAFFTDSDAGYTISSPGVHTTTLDFATRKVLYEFEYDQNQNPTRIEDQFGNQTSIQRDPNGVAVAIISPDGIRTDLNIDSSNHLNSIIYQNGSSYLFEYTIDGMLTKKTEPNGNWFEHFYDAFGRITSVSDQEGGSWLFSQEAQSNFDLQTVLTTGEGDITTYLDHSYSDGRFVSTITDPSQSQTVYERSADGLSVSKALACGMNLSFEYDLDSVYKYPFIKEMNETTPSLLRKNTIRAVDYEDTDFDSVPDVITDTITINGKATTRLQDVLQSKIAILSPLNRAVYATYNPETLQTDLVQIKGLYDTNYSYESNGRLSLVQTNTRATSFTYDVNGYLASITDPENKTTYYNHDSIGMVTDITRPDGSTLSFSYDQNGNLTILTNPVDVDFAFSYNFVNLPESYQTPLSGGYSYVYDKDRRLIQTNFPSGKQIVNVYDSGNLAQIQTAEGNIDLIYSCSSKISSMSKGSESITYGYDGKLLTDETVAGTLNANIHYTYDNDFDVTDMTYAGGTETFNYDLDGLLTGSGNYTISRNIDNGLPEAVNGNGLTISRGFNGYGELDSQDTSVNGSSAASWNLTRDDNGRIVTQSETVAGQTIN